MSKYISITIGPITKVISLAKTTRGMWAASYLFSYLAKEIIRPFKDKDRKFILSMVNEEMYSRKFAGAGVFPDRYVFEAEDGDFDELKSHIDFVFSNLAKKIRKSDSEVNDIKLFLKQAFKVYFFEQKRGDAEERAFIEQCEHTLGLLEEQDTFVPTVVDGKDYLSQFINGDMAGMHFLLEDAGIGKFKSIVEISSENNTFFSYKNEDQNLRHIYERYIAIVYADGDSMTETLAKVKTSDLSEALFDFNKSAINIINNFDGQPVFIGGDDLFFFAPIFHEGKSIFTLLQTLDDTFHQSLKGKNIDGPTLSFGVSVTYYKYPMSEAVILSKTLLTIAKGREALEKSRFKKTIFEKKNNVLFSVQKHSGQTRAALLHKGCPETVKLFNNMADKYTGLSVDDNDDGNKMLSSVMHNLREHEPVLFNAIQDKELLDNYFANNYNEDGHDTYKSFLGELADLLYVACAEYGDVFSALDLAYALLQFIHLVNSKRDE